jgi:hypothetical protein
MVGAGPLHDLNYVGATVPWLAPRRVQNDGSTHPVWESAPRPSCRLRAAATSTQLVTDLPEEAVASRPSPRNGSAPRTRPRSERSRAIEDRPSSLLGSASPAALRLAAAR